MKTNITITGASGFIGKVICSYLNSHNNSVHPISLRSSEWEKDVNNSSSSVFIHLSGKAHSVPKTKSEVDEFYEVNYKKTIKLCDAIEKLKSKPKAFIFASSVAVYGLDSGTDINEDYPLNGNTPYSESKILAEQYLKKWALKNNIVLSILRLPLVAGAYPPGNLGAMIQGVESGKYLSIGEANARKSIVWAEDIAKIIPKLVETGGVYNLTDGYHPSFGELENAISKALNKSNPIKISYFIAKAIAKVGDLLGPKAPINTKKLSKITSTLTFDDTKASEKLGWNPTKVLDKIPEIV